MSAVEEVENILIQNSKFKIQNSTDFHCHLLPGLDDGPTTLDEAVEMASALRKAGFTTIHCTPHLIRGCYEADNRMVMEGIRELRSQLEALKIDLTLLPGREYYLDEFFLSYLDDPLPLGDTKYLLVEIPDATSPDLVIHTFTQVIRAGFVPLIAHPERCRLFELPVKNDGQTINFFSAFFGGANSKFKIQNSEFSEPSLLERLLEMDCKFQGNLGSFAGLYGERVRKNAVRLKDARVYSHFGTDLHVAANMDMLTKTGLGLSLAEPQS